MKIWDIAPWSLLLPEAGGLITDLEGNVVRYDLAREPFDRTYTVLAANPPLHAQLVQLTRQAI
jgi:fructose-1,6-bisphosphatase/inositol monophosphatase family enzyme